MNACGLTAPESPMIAWLKRKTSEGQIPFELFNFDQDVDGSIFVGAENLAGLTVPVLNDLRQAEAVVLDLIDSNSGNVRLKVQYSLRVLGEAFYKHWQSVLAEIESDLDSLGAEIATGDKNGKAELESKRALLANMRKFKKAQVQQYALSKDDDYFSLIVSTDAYQNYQDEIWSELNNLITLSNELGGNGITEWAKVAFFLASRLGGEWLQPKKLYSLTRGQVNAVNAFIAKEANGGVEPSTDTDTEGKQN